MILRSLSELNSEAEKFGPELFRKCSPRRIVPPHGYPHPREQAGLLYSYLCAIPSDGEVIDRAYAVTASEICKHAAPTYFVQDNFLRACLATEPPEGMVLADVKLPMPAFTIVPSWEIQREIFGGFWIPFIQVASLTAGDYPLINGRQGKLTDHVFTVQASAFKDDATHTPVEYSANALITLPVSEALRDVSPVLIWKDAETKTTTELPTSKQQIVEIDERFEKITKEMAQQKIRQHQREIEVLEKEINESRAILVGLDYAIKSHTGTELSKEIVGTMCAVAIKLSLALSVRPELIGSSELIRPEKRKRGVVVKDALWSPIILGRNYRIVYGGHHSGDDFTKKRMHWRRGHFRNQAYGLRTAPQHKLIWIEPVLINANE